VISNLVTSPLNNGRAQGNNW